MAAPDFPSHAQPHSSKAQAWGWAEAFVISQTALPAILYFPGTQAIRPIARIGAYAISLVILLKMVSRPEFKKLKAHPAFAPLRLCLMFLGMMIFNPLTASLLSGVAAVGFYVAILAPLLWAPALVQSAAHMKRLLWVLLICNGINSLVGILQVHDPARWMPAEFSQILTRSSFGLSVVTYTGVDGRTIIRPPGLFDTPGAVAGPGLLAGFLGLVLAVGTKSRAEQLVAAAFGFCGVTAIYLSLVRSSLLVMAAMLAVYAILQQTSQAKSKIPQLLLLVTGVAAGGFHLATNYGGETIENRFSTLIEEKPADFYYRSRGIDVENGFKEILPKYPLGAGLGRWGMVAHYMGAGGGEEGGLWAETQFPAWIIDGGAVLLIGYCAAIWMAWKWLLHYVKTSSDETLIPQAILVLAMMAGMFIHCFSFPVFSTQIGLQFWFLIGASYGAIIHSSPQEPSVERGPKPIPRIGRRF